MLKYATLTILLVAQPAQACHIFKYWHFKQPQHCEAVTHTSEQKDWYVEIVLTPKVMDEISHGIGVEKIKQLNK